MLKVIVPNIISPYQIAFVPGWLIQENTILAQEIFHALKKKRARKGLVVIKIDIEKAFDFMEWSFLLSLGFNQKWINWIKEYISTVSYSILINGSTKGFIHLTRGIRRGNPLSPFLFIMGSEVLSRPIFKEEYSNSIEGISFCRRGLALSHLPFADDLILFRTTFVQNLRVSLPC